VAAPAGAATYRSPGYKGVRTAPKTTPAPPPKALTLGAGERPQVLVDAAGTSHIVWNDPRGDAADALHYCRMKRGATTCDVQKDLVPDGPGDGREDPRFNSEFGTPRVLAVGDQVALVTHRYPNPVIAPNGQTEIFNTWLFVSNDGGDTFSPGVLVGRNETSGVPTVYGPPGSPRIGLISDTQTGGPFFQEITGARYETRQADLGDNGSSVSLAPVGTSVMAAFGDLRSTIHLRQWNGQGDVFDSATWSETTLPGDDPLLTAGPRGIFLMSRAPAGQDRRYTIRPVAPGGAAGAPVPLEGTENASERDLFEDPSGRLHATYRVADEQGQDQLVRRISGDAKAFDPGQVLQQTAAGLGIQDTDVASAADGGGIVVSQQGATRGVGPIVATAFGTRLPTGVPGLGGEPGAAPGPDVVDTCQRLEFGPVDVQAAEGCLLGSPKRGVKVSEGTIRLNGLDIVPSAGVKIVLDANAKTINTTGTVRVVARAPGIPDITLYTGELHIDLKLEAGDLLKDDPSSPCKGKRLADFRGDVDLLGFPIKGGVQVFLTEDAACIPVSLELPKAFGGIRGAAVLRATNAKGLTLDTLNIAVDRAFVGPLLVEKLRVGYTAATDRWEGKAKMGVPPQPGGLAVDGHFVFERGAFKEGSITVTAQYPGIPLGPWPAYLAQAGGSFGLEPTRIGLNASVGIIQAAPPNYVFRVNGQFKVTFSDPVVFELHGQGYLYTFQIAQLNFLLNTDGFAKLDGGIVINLVAAKIKANVDMFVDVPSGTFSAGLKGEGCVAGLCVFGAEAVISSKGLGICVTDIVDHGAGYRWGASLLDVDIDLFSCHMSDYRVDPPPATARSVGGDGARPRAVPPGGRAFTVAKGAGVENLRIEGAGGAQTRVALVSPSGQRIEPVTDPKAPGTTVFAAYPDGAKRSFVGLKDPAPGVWQAVPLDGQPAIAVLAQSHAVVPPRATAKVGGKARARTLTYAVSTGEGLRTTFVETGPMGSRRLGVAKGAKGTIRFAPAPGPAGSRRIEAIVERGGVPELRTTVASYRAPAVARPGRVRGLKLRRTRHGLTARWRPAANARRYAVRIDLPDGRRLLRVVRPARLRLTGIPGRGTVTVRVAARHERGKAGRTARASVRR
jgi:hypothetical protein